ncbi:transcriptional regulator [Pantoea wallisii]|uniref:Transcriptional regulator n=1 Tax=Pantoea wallisii TaxID=1076551 RepID=A0A1X1DBF2_9GAMM|nr:helix-turn-helix transcriptional regulator [Pantoea wallisii]ORM73890.1 transcriptional regulator [Pantoea wallisii]
MKPTSSLQETFCRRLKQARLAKHFSQKGLGIAAGIEEFSASARINRYELGVHKPDLLTLQLLAKALDVPAAYFLAENDRLAEMILAFPDDTNATV